MLNDNTASSYLRENGISKTVRSVIKLEGGILNNVFLAETDNGSIVIKEHLRKSRIAPHICLPGNRYLVEKSAYLFLSEAFKKAMTPKTFHFDDSRKIIVMEALDRNKRLDSVVESIDPEKFRELGGILANIFLCTTGKRGMAGQFNNTPFQELKYRKKYYENISDKTMFPVRDALMKFARNSRISLSLGDVRLSNIFYHDNRFLLIDFEGAYYCDPAIDIAYVMAELFSKHLDGQGRQMKERASNLWKGFMDNAHPGEKEELEWRIVKHMGFHLIDQVVGIINREFIFKNGPRIVETAKRIITDQKIRSPEDIMWSK